MAKKKFLVNIDLNLNQLINSRAENGTGFTTGGVNSKGRLMYDTSTNRVLYDTGVAIETIANLNDVTGLLDFHGGYNALTNTPNLVNPPSGTTFKGDFYIVTVAGTFYGTALEVGDSLFASVDNPTTLSGWVIAQGNVAYATETIAGIILLATQTEVNTGTNNSKAVTPLTLATYVADTRQNIYNTDGTLSANRTVNLSNKDLNFIGSGTSTYNYKVDNGVQTSEIYLDANQVTLNLNNSTLSLHSQIKVVNGTLSFKVYNDALTIDRSLAVNQFGTRINSIYYLPNVDGTAGQVMTTDGSGNLSWGNTSSLNIYNGNGTLTSDRTVTLGDKNLYFVGTGADQVFQTQQTSGGKNSITQQFVGEINQQVEDGGDYSNRQQNANSIYQRIEGSNGVGSVYTTLQQLTSAYLLSVNNNGLSTSQTSTFNIFDDTAQLLILTSGVINQFLEILAQYNQIVFRISSDDISNPFDTNLAIRPEGVVINNAYTLPKVDGTSGQVLTTNGSGVASWSSATTTNIYNTNGSLTANRTVGIGDFSLNFTGVNGSISLRQEDTTANTLSQITNTSYFNLIRITTPTLNAESSINQQPTVIVNSVNSISNSCVHNLDADGIIISLYDTFSTNLAFRLDVLTSGLRINNQYTFPKVDGTAGQFLQTNGAGVLGWSTGSNINIYNADGSLSSNRTVTINDRTLLFEGNQFSTYRVDLRDVTTERYSITDNGLTRILNEVGNNSFTLYNKVDITSGAVTTTSTSGAQSSTITSIPTTIVNTVSAVAQSCSTALTLNGFTINNVYTLPKVDGTAGQVLTTNGSGVVTWGAGTVNIYNINGTLTANRTLTAVNFNLNFSGVGLSGVTSFSRSDGASSQTNYDLRYDYFNVVSNTDTKTASILISPEQILKGVSDDSTNLSANYQQFSTAFRFFLNNALGVENSLSIEANGININSAYTIPKVDGTAGQVLTTNGSGVVTWGAGGSGTSDIWKLNPNETYRGFSFNNNATTIVADGGAVASTSASTLAVTVSGSSFVNKQIRLRFYASVVSAGRYTGTRGSALLWFIGGGFRYVCDFNISDTAYVSQPQQFYGLASTTNDLAYAGVSGVQINTLFNIIGVGNDTADTNLQIFHNDATGTATKIDLGSGFPANRTSGAVSTTVYEIQILNLPASADVLYRVVNKETGAIATGTLTTNLPASTLGLNFFASRCMTTIGSVTGTGQFDLCRLGVYSML